ncbi:MAG: nitroreductase [Verrucomicrobia bacterium]|nr:nitroreductase [Verrucomicrobiota bacterium]
MKLTPNKATSPWNISAEDFPTYGTMLEKWKFFLGYAVLAPSSHNSQPWRFRILNDQVEIYADRQRACPVVDPDDRELIMSCGCALYHLRTAIQHYGYLGEVEIFPKPADHDLLARVSMGTKEEVSAEESMVFYAIPKRRTNRQPFSDDPLPEALLAALQRTAEKESATLRFVREEELKHAVADLVAEGDRWQWGNQAFRRELAKWVHSNRSAARDGIPGYAQGIDDLMSYAGPLVVRTFDMGDGQAAKDHEVATGSPALAVLGTVGDSPREWLAAGQALAGVLLRARVEDVWASFLNQPIEVPYLRMKLHQLVPTRDFPQAVLRFGFGKDLKPTPRREVDAVLTG